MGKRMKKKHNIIDHSIPSLSSTRKEIKMKMMKMKNKKPRRSKKIDWDRHPPNDIIDSVLSKLPFSSLPTFRLVCNSWNNLVLKRNFVDDYPKPPSTSKFFYALIYDDYHRHYSKFHFVDLDSKHIHHVASFSFHTSWSESCIKILHSCNGLLLLSLTPISTSGFKGLSLLNPMTNEYIQLPSKSNHVYHYGFGFSPKTKSYKIVRLSRKKFGTLVEILTFTTTSSTSGQWSKPFFVPFKLSPYGVYFDGGLYWEGIGYRHHPNIIPIFRFDVEHEKFNHIPIFFPYDEGLVDKEGEPIVAERVSLGVLKGALYVTFYLDWEVSEFQVWKMEQHSCSWIKAFVVQNPYNTARIYFNHSTYNNEISISQLFGLKLINICEDGKILCLYCGCFFILHDPTTGRSKLLSHLRSEKYLILHHIDSLSFAPLHKILVGDISNE